MLKKALIYLGLGPDEEYEQYDDFAPGQGMGAPVDDERPAVRAVSEPAAATRPASSTVRPIPSANPSPAPSSVRAIPAEPTAPAVTRPSAAATGTANPVPAPGVTAGGPRADGASAIRIVESAPSKPYVVAPSSFNDAQGLGDRFKVGQPVIMNLQGVERDLRRRLVDFASGLCYALDGKMDRVTDQVYLLAPDGVEVSADDARRALD